MSLARCMYKISAAKLPNSTDFFHQETNTKAAPRNPATHPTVCYMKKMMTKEKEQKNKKKQKEKIANNGKKDFSKLQKR